MKKIVLLLLTTILTVSLANSQSCRVEITGIDVVGPGSPPPALHISVKGRITGGTCTRVSVQLCCLDASGASTGCRVQQIAVQPDGTWAILFKDFLCSCSGGSFTVIATATCISGDCAPGELKKTLSCTPPGNNCPMITNVAVNVQNCTDDGTSCKARHVVFTPTISGTCDAWSFNFGDNSSPAGGAGTPGPIPHDYYLFPPIDPVLTIFKSGCAPVSFPVTSLSFQLCDECPPPAGIQFSLNSNKCVLTGTISASVCEANYLNFIIDYGDGTPTTTEDISLLNGYSLNHTYNSDGSKTITITLLRANNSNCTYTTTVNITNCCKDCGTGGDNGDESCGWKFWECFEWSWCWFLAILAGIYVAVRLILVAGGWNINLPLGQTVTWAEILEALGLGLLLLLITVCPCETAYMIILGATTALLTIVGILIGGGTLPKWLVAVILGLVLIASMMVLIEQQGC